MEQERFVIWQNIEHYRGLWDITTDLERRGLIERLLLEEEAKLKKCDEDHKKNPPPLARRLDLVAFV
jgi:hypothetical protein